MDKYIGRLLDNRYEILEVIGTGGMAVVYKARCHRLNRLVAIKILKDDYLEDEDFRARFHAESQAVAMLSHPNIVSVYDVSTSLMADYIVMELIEGITLKQYMEKKGVLNWKETLHFAIQIAKALEHAHSRGIVHRDIKPHNVMVLKNGSVKVADFGIARMMSEGNTLTKEALGSVHYISPEQAKGGRVDNRSDIYSLGVVMYEMMSGRPPYDGDSPVSVAIAHINGGAPLPSTFNPNIPGGMEQIIMKAMAHDLGDRYASATQMLKDMEEFRKDPTILFDYNIPPVDAVTRLQKPPLEFQHPTTAQKVVQRDSGERRPPQPRPRSTAPRPPQNKESRRRAQEELEEQKSNRVATIAIVSCSVVAIIAVVVFLFTFFNGGVFAKKDKLVEVPPFIGQVFEDLPEYKNLEIKMEEAYDETYEEGIIIDQNPKAGDRVVEGSRVVLKVSLGPMPSVVTMRNLVDMSQAQAESVLDSLEMSLKITIQKEYSDTIAEGNVTRTEPGKDVELKSGQDITLWISQGAEIKTSTMPNLIEQSREAAEKTLNAQDLKLKITVEEVFDSVIPEGRVIRTEPEKGDDLQTGQTVTLYVSKGPQLAKMPYVQGLDVAKAVSILRSAGFNTPTLDYVESDKEKDVVLEQSEEPNSMVDITKEIKLKISKGKKDIKKDVVIDLRGSAATAECKVTVTRDGKVVFEQRVPAGTQSITIPGQTGSGPQKYIVIIDELDGWDEWVTFGGNG